MRRGAVTLLFLLCACGDTGSPEQPLNSAFADSVLGIFGISVRFGGNLATPVADTRIVEVDTGSIGPSVRLELSPPRNGFTHMRLHGPPSTEHPRIERATLLALDSAGLHVEDVVAMINALSGGTAQRSCSRGAAGAFVDDVYWWESADGGAAALLVRQSTSGHNSTLAQLIVSPSHRSVRSAMLGLEPGPCDED